MNRQMMHQMNPLQMVQQRQQNPVAFLQQAGLTIPNDLNNPNDIIQYLMNSGQISQQKYNWARQMSEMMRKK